MAYSPIENSPGDQRRLFRDSRLMQIARRHSATPAQVALAWLLRHDDMVVIPKAASVAHVRENRAAIDLTLTAEDLAELDRSFPPPRGKTALESL